MNVYLVNRGGWFVKKRIIILLTLVISIMLLVGCETEAQRVSYNLSQETDNFNVENYCDKCGQAIKHE